MHRSLSDYISLLEREGELVRIAAPVSPMEEIAEITDRVSKTPGGGKALLFENTGTEFPVLTNMFGSARRMALALGVGSLGELSERVDGLLRQAMAPRPSFADKLRALPLLAGMSRWFPRTVSGRGECQQVVRTGAEASLAALPILKCWPADGGRFVTLPMVNTVDPQTGVRNVGMYRMQLFDDRTTGMHWHIHKTGARHYDAWKRSGRRMPVSVALGGDPAYTYAATAPMPDNMDEYLLAGFLRRRPVKLVKCVTNDIYVHVTALTRRRDAVYPATVVGIPPQEDACIAQATERIFLAPIRMALQPEVRDMTMPEAGTAHNIAVVSIDSRYAGREGRPGAVGRRADDVQQIHVRRPGRDRRARYGCIGAARAQPRPAARHSPQRGDSRCPRPRDGNAGLRRKNCIECYGPRCRGRVRESAGACNACACRSPTGCRGRASRSG